MNIHFLVTRVSNGDVRFSSSTTVDTPNENHQTSIGLYAEKQRVGGEVDYNVINNPSY